MSRYDPKEEETPAHPNNIATFAYTERHVHYASYL